MEACIIMIVAGAGTIEFFLGEASESLGNLMRS